MLAVGSLVKLFERKAAQLSTPSRPMSGGWILNAL